MEQRRILVAVTGGIAAYKVPELIRILRRAGASVRCAMTPAAREFVAPLVLQTLTGYSVRTDLFDAAQEGEIDHIALADWAELVILAPATANTLAKLSCGLADDLVSAVLLATRAPILVAPAMNVNMWEHPATRSNMETLRQRGIRTIGPEVGELACGWEGAGRMSQPEAVAAEAELLLGSRDLEGEVVLVSAGGTREPIDTVRYLGNRSSGKMGFAVAAEAARRGASVVLVAGPTPLVTPPGVRRIDVVTALELRDAMFAEFDSATITVMAAAVADFRAAQRSELKIKKEDLDDDSGLTLELTRNPDILAELCQRKGDRVVIGFAAESHDLVASARRKIARKGCDLLVANNISGEATGFDTDDNAVVFVWPDSQIEELPTLPKRDVASQLLDRVAKSRGGNE
ncbi:MAG: bifunctional phosphopantothenoylcysteine decarboxylase/phosphopantothenate--cysteine ligase CoaBC [Myxococcota bacterium]